MTMRDAIAGLDYGAEGAWMAARVAEWYRIPRSITGQGVRDTLSGLAQHIALEVTAVPTGTPVFDWTIPEEWNIREAWIANAAGERIVDFAAHNLHVMGYSVPVRERMPLSALRAHLHSDPARPEVIPYRTSYFKKDWAFCLPHALLCSLPQGEYDVCIDATLAPGVLNYGECVLPGETASEILISAHVCHPQLANDNLSGVALAACLARVLQGVALRHTLRFVFAPGTIGAIAWLAQHEAHARQQVRHGLILACVGDAGPYRYKQSRRGDAAVDRAAAQVLGASGLPHEVQPFIPYGYDERQYCSPGFNLPVGCFMRSGPGGYPEYHSSADNLALVTAEALGDSLRQVLGILEVLEGDAVYVSLNPNCEPQLGRRGLYGMTGGLTDRKAVEMALLWVLNYSDGAHSLLDIAMLSGLPFPAIRQAADHLLAAELLAEVAQA